MDERAKLDTGRVPVFSPPGLILLWPADGKIASNSEANRILAYPDVNLPPTRLKQVVAQKIPLALFSETAPADEHLRSEVISGRRRYVCSRWSLGTNGPQPLPAIAVLLERRGSPDVIMHELCTHFHLTFRERQAVALLVKGMTSKQIAQQMGISPNTVKSFLRTVMTKAGVSTRAGLIGRVAGITVRPPAEMMGDSREFDRMRLRSLYRGF